MTKHPILVVDDDPQMLRTVERVLSGRYPVQATPSATAALELATSLQPALAVLDIRMPGMDGFELMERLRGLKSDVDVVFMTGYVYELDEAVMRRIGENALYFIPKPFDANMLVSIVERCFEFRDLAEENRRYVQRLEDELQAAREFQRAIMPAPIAEVAGVSFAAHYDPCLELSGDFYEYVPSTEGVTIVVADVSGHGATAAMLTTIVKSAVHDAHSEDYDPLSIVRRVWSAIRAFDDERFVTLFCARVIGQREMEYLNAGHPSGIHWRPGEELCRLTATGPLISPAIEQPLWETRRVELAAGDRVLLYTDGVTETRGDGERFGVDRLLAAIDRSAELDCASLLEGLEKTLASFAGAHPQDDDRTLLAFGV